MVNSEPVDKVHALIAERAFGKAIDLLRSSAFDQEDGEALYLIGFCFGFINDFPRAMDYLRRSIDRGFDPYWPAYNMGGIELRRGNRERAILYLSWAAIQRPHEPDPWRLLRDADAEIARQLDRVVNYRPPAAKNLPAETASSGGITGYLQTLTDSLGVRDWKRQNRPVEEAISRVVTAVTAGTPVLVCGDSHSLGTAMTLVAGLIGTADSTCPAYNALCLQDSPAMGGLSRQVEAYGRRGGVLIALAASDDQDHLVSAVVSAKQLGMTAIAMTGPKRGGLAEQADILIDVEPHELSHLQQAQWILCQFLGCEIKRRALGNP